MLAVRVWALTGNYAYDKSVIDNELTAVVYSWRESMDDMGKDNLRG